jgi:hypothetical protein
MTAPKITVKRMPTRSAIRPMTMPPTPDPIHIKALAKAGIERSPLTSAAMSLSATSVIHGAPKAMAIINRTTVATTHDLRVSTDENVGCSMDFASCAAECFLPDETLSQGVFRRDAKYGKFSLNWHAIEHGSFATAAKSSASSSQC